MRADAKIFQPLRASTSLTSVIAQMKKLPPLPSVAHDVLSRLNDEFVDGNEVADVVGRDPGIAARLIGLANSAYFGLSKPVGSMREVVTRVLGVDTVRSLAIALAARQTFDASLCPAFDTKHYWVHSLLTAESVKKVANRDTEASSDERELAYVAGLCHNLGLMVLACIEPDRTHTVLQYHLNEGVTEKLGRSFAREFGATHRELTHHVALHWELPDLVLEAYEQRCRPDSDNRLATMIDVGAESAGSIAPRNLATPNLAPMAKRLEKAESELRESMPSERDRARAEAVVQAL